jgi:copper resistance protein D
VPELLGFTRALHDAMSLSVFGTFLFCAVIAPPAIERAPVEAARCARRRLGMLAAVSLVATLVTGVALLMHQAIALSGAQDLTGSAQAIAAVLLQTQFGHVLLARFTLLLAAAVCLWPRREGRPRWVTLTGVVLSGAAVLLLAATGYVAAMEGTDRLAAMLPQAAHLAAASAWLGGLVPLAVALALPPSAAIVAANASRHWGSPASRSWPSLPGSTRK